MSLSQPRAVFGVHSFTPYNRATGQPYGSVKVLSSSSLSFAGALVALNGGSNKYPWAVEEGKISSQLSLKTSEYPNFLFQLFGGSTPVDNAAETGGNVSALTNVNGTSLQNATTGISSVAVLAGSESDLKFAKYVVKAISATTVQVYASTDADFGSGTVKNFAGDDLAISATTYTIVSGADTNLTGFGLKLVGGSGTIAMTIGHTASFEVRPINTVSTVFSIGAISSVFPEFSAILMAKKSGDGTLFEIDCPRVKGLGIPLGLDEDKFSQADIKCMVLYDATLDYVARLRRVDRTNPN
jgi:hypothetical protein